MSMYLMAIGQSPLMMTLMRSHGYTPRMKAHLSGLTVLTQIQRITTLHPGKKEVSNLNHEKPYWYNWTHLNEKGADIFTEIFKEDLYNLISPVHKDIFTGENM